MEKKGNPNSQPRQSQLLSLQRRPRAKDEVGRRGQWTDRARIFALPREPSPSHAASASSSCCKLPPLHLGQPKVGTTKLKELKVPQVELRELQTAPQGSRRWALSLRGDRLPPLPATTLPRLARPAQLPPVPRLESPRDTQSWGTELRSVGELLWPCSPYPRKPYTPVPRVFLPPLRVAQEGTAHMSPSWQQTSLPPIPSRARAMESSLTGTVLESEGENENKLTKGEYSREQELSQMTEAVRLLRGDSKSEEELSLVEEAIEVIPGDSTSDPELSPVEEDIKVVQGDSRSGEELSEVEEAIEDFPGDSKSEEELSSVEKDIKIIPGDSTSDPELSPVEEDIDVIPEDSKSEEELSEVEEDITVIPGDSSSDPEVSPMEEDIKTIPGDSTSGEEPSEVEEAIEDFPGDSKCEEELSSVEEDIEAVPQDSTSDPELLPVEEDIEVVPGDRNSDEELSSVEEDIELSPGDSTSDEELSPVEKNNELSQGDKTSYKELFQGEETHIEELSQGESDSRNKLSQGDSDKELSPEDSKHDTELSFGEDYNVQDMSPWEGEQFSQWEVSEDEELSHWEDDDEELMRRALLGGMERDQSSSSDVLEWDKISRNQKVLDWLEANFSDNYGAEEDEEDDRSQGLSHQDWSTEKVEAPWQATLDSTSSVSSNVRDNVCSKGKHRRAQELSQGEDAMQDKIWKKPWALVDDDDPLEGPSWAYPSTSPGLQSPLHTEREAGFLARAAEVEETSKSLSAEKDKAADSSVTIENTTSLGTESQLAVLCNTPGSSQPQLHMEQKIIRETLSKAQLEAQALAHLQEERAILEQSIAARMVPAQHSLSRPLPAQQGSQALREQPAAPKKRPSRLRWALRALRRLFRCPCLRPQPDE